MAILKCKMCGGDLTIEENMTVCECEYCGSKQTVPMLDNEKKRALFTRANRLRYACEFDKAFSVYESIVTEFQEEAEAYWGLILCKYGIEYVDDPKTGRKIPTCHRSSYDSIMEDSDFEMVMEYSDVTSRAVYRTEAKAIEELRVGIIEVSSKEEPYDVFICYKETSEDGQRTIDSVIAQDVYEALTDEGYKVFFSRISLEDKLGQEYEPCIFSALNSAKVMLAFGTNYEYYNAVWVKNEWSRFLNLIEKGQKKTLIPCYKDIDAYDMPAEFRHLQAQDMGKIGAIQDLVRGVGKIIGDKNPDQIQFAASGGGNSNSLTQRGMMYLEDSEFYTARDYFDRALDINPTDSNAYLGKFLAVYQLNSVDDLQGNKVADLENSKDFKRAIQFATPDKALALKRLMNDNALKIGRARLLDVIREYCHNVTKIEIDRIVKEKTAEAYEALYVDDGEGIKKATEISCALMSNSLVNQSIYDYRQFVEGLGIQQEIIRILKSRHEEYTIDELRCIKPLHKYSRKEIVRYIRPLVDYGIIIEGKSTTSDFYHKYSTRDVWKEKQKAAKIRAVYLLQKQPIIDEMNSKIEEVKQLRMPFEDKKNDLINIRAELGLFKMKKKKEITKEIEALDLKLSSLPSEQTIVQQYQQKIAIIEENEKKELKQAEITIRAMNSTHPINE